MWRWLRGAFTRAMNSLYGISERCGPSVSLRNCQIAKKATMRTTQSKSVLCGCLKTNLGSGINHAIGRSHWLRAAPLGSVARRDIDRSACLGSPFGVRNMRSQGWLLAALAVLCALCAVFAGSARAAQGSYLELRLDGVINPLKVRHLARALERAESERASFVLLTIDTPGGLVSSLQE